MTEDTSGPGSAHDTALLGRTVRRVIVIGVIVAVLFSAWGIFSRLHARSALRRQTVDDALLTVVTVKPDLDAPAEELVLPGIVQAYMESSIYARTTGYLKSWSTDIGAQVHKGQLLAEIETPEVDRQLGQARADQATAQANLALSRSTNARWQSLLLTKSVSAQDADEKAGDTAAKTAIADSAAQNVARLNDLESFKRVVAPFDGVITARNTDVGSLINAGQAMGAELFRLADTHTLRIYAQVPEAYAAATRTGLEAELHFTEHPGKEYPAKTVRTSRALDPSARTLQVELQLDNRAGEFFPGAYTEIHFKLHTDMPGMRLPSNTVLFRADGLQVATVDAQHKIKVKNITQGRDFGKTLEILSGIDQGDDVVVNPPDSIEDGTPVRIAPAQPDDDKK